MRLPWLLRRCKSGHVYRIVYGDERNVIGKYACVECPKTKGTPIPGVDLVFDPTLREIEDLRRKIRE